MGIDAAWVGEACGGAVYGDREGGQLEMEVGTRIDGGKSSRKHHDGGSGLRFIAMRERRVLRAWG